MLPRQGCVCDIPIDQFMRTALFYLNYPALTKLDFNLLSFKLERLVGKQKNSFELLNQYLDSNILSYRVGNFLFAGQWYKSKDYSEFSTKEINLKVAMIINELLLSAKLRMHSAEFQKSLPLTYAYMDGVKRISSLVSSIAPRATIYLIKLYLLGRNTRSRLER